MRLDRGFLVVWLSVLVTGTAQGTTWSVDQAAACSDSTCAPCCTIQGAVFKASDDDTISVAPGTYPENIDFRDMLSVGTITLEAASGPGTVLVSPPTGHALRHGGISNHDTVWIDGIDFTSGSGSSCVYLDHGGGAVLYDVDASNCGYTAFVLDNTGNITMRRCTANYNDRHGIQIDGASGAYLEDCTTNFNAMDGVLIFNVDAMVQLVNPTAEGNLEHGLDFDMSSWLLIQGATVTDNEGRGIWIQSTDMVAIQDSDVQGSHEVGIDIEWNGVDPVDSVSITNTTVSNNGLVANDSGVRLREIAGPVTVTSCTLDGNGVDGLSVEASVVGNAEITGGQANGNNDDGLDLRNVGDVIVVGAMASSNNEHGFTTDVPGRVRFEDSVASNNLNGSGFNIFWQDPDPLDEVTLTGCVANDNGLSGGGNGIIVNHVAGPVSILGTTTNGNSRTGVRVDDAAGSVLIRKAESSFGLEEGIKIDVDSGPVTVMDCEAVGNVDEGLIIFRENLDVESVFIRRNFFTNNGSGGVALFDLAGGGTFHANCNDLVGNATGLYLASPVTVDARRTWWGDPSGPSGQGPGAGDSVFAEPGGTILHEPWLPSSFTTPGLSCPTFGSDFESGTLDEWDASSP